MPPGLSSGHSRQADQAGDGSTGRGGGDASGALPPRSGGSDAGPCGGPRPAAANPSAGAGPKSEGNRRRRARGRPSGHFRADLPAPAVGGNGQAGLRNSAETSAPGALGPSGAAKVGAGRDGARGREQDQGLPRGSDGAQGTRPAAALAGTFLSGRTSDSQLYAALDLGTNNCRLLIARPEERGFKVVDAFSRIVRLGEGVGASGLLSDAAMDRAIDALDNCQRKLVERGVSRFRLIATEACRAAGNGEEFIARVQRETGLALEIVNRETEARLAVAGCATLVDREAEGVLLFDIGGGSSEIVWLDLRNRGNARGYALTRFIRAWTSLPVGVVNLAERHGGMHVTHQIFEDMVDDVSGHLQGFAVGSALNEAIDAGQVHMLGTSGTVTTLAGVHFGLRRYDRRRVDGAWLADEDVAAMIEKLRAMSYDERIDNPCIGADRADLVLAGCAILEAIRRRWTCSRLRVADRGLREGILTELMAADGVWSRGNRPHRGQKGKT
ncbi:Ppx/GppA phosphatase family protein [Pannonibacter sp.]|uniref:Ppx/GppA phosphatase family protein n=1 Tax=Pannonibacter sp. TaxID=1906786 RepID=UPI003F705C3B